MARIPGRIQTQVCLKVSSPPSAHHLPRRYGSHVCRAYNQVLDKDISQSNVPGDPEQGWVSSHHGAPSLCEKQCFKQTSKCPEQSITLERLLFHQLYNLSHFNKLLLTWNLMIQNRQRLCRKCNLETKGSCFLVHIKTHPYYQRINQRKSGKAALGSACARVCINMCERKYVCVHMCAPTLQS